MSCKAPCNKYRDKIEALEQEVVYLKSILAGYIQSLLKSPNHRLTETIMKYSQALQSDTIKESTQNRPTDGEGVEG